MSLYFLNFVLLSVGLYCILRKRNLIKIIIGVVICEYAVNLFLILIGYKLNGRAPIASPTQNIQQMVDPLPQAIVLTSIVISLATTAVAIAVAVRIYSKYETFDITKIRRLRG